ncbi:MAG: Mov34/MPN/PAD-1 family protein [Isosphaeraceae bacterium]
MSGDEISFEDVRYREPVRMLRPDRDRRHACLTYQVPALGDLPIFLDHRAADAIERHALADTSVELGGILLGKECVDEATGVPFVWITQSLEAKHYENTQASFTYTHDSWEEISRERDRRFPDLDIVGWYHTHPSFGIFLSHHDVFIHQHFFAQALQVAYVVDPIQQTRGFFQWRDRNLVQVEGFYLTADRGDRPALAKLANDLENLPSTPGPGGMGLSPRLEAELIKMLARPSTPQYVNSPADRVQAAAVFGMLGMFLGVLGLGALMLLYQVHSRVLDQGEAIQALRRNLDQTSSGQRLALDTLLEKAGTENPKSFQERYERTARARDDARQQLLAQQTINETLATRAKFLEGEAARLGADLDFIRRSAEENEAKAKLVPGLQEKLAAAERELAEKTLIANSADGKNAAAVLHTLNLFRYATYFLGALCAALAAAVGYLFLRPLDEPDSDRPVVVQPHRIS